MLACRLSGGHTSIARISLMIVVAAEKVAAATVNQFGSNGSEAVILAANPIEPHGADGAIGAGVETIAMTRRIRTASSKTTPPSASRISTSPGAGALGGRQALRRAPQGSGRIRSQEPPGTRRAKLTAMLNRINRLQIAKRGEIAIRIQRACAELGIPTIPIHFYEGRYALHQFKVLEVYALSDGGNSIVVALGRKEQTRIVRFCERGCSIQRRHRKVLEAAPVPKSPPDFHFRLFSAAVCFADNVQHQRVEIVELLVSGKDYYFIQMNPRLQVDHTETDETCLLDEGGNPVGVYLDINRILEVPEVREADAIHPAYGLLSESQILAKQGSNRPSKRPIARQAVHSATTKSSSRNSSSTRSILL